MYLTGFGNFAARLLTILATKTAMRARSLTQLLTYRDVRYRINMISPCAWNGALSRHPTHTSAIHP